MERIYRGDGTSIELKAECWQHDPYRVYLPLSVKQLKKLAAFQAASQPRLAEDGGEDPTTGDPLRWGSYAARVIPIVAPRGRCPHCG